MGHVMGSLDTRISRFSIRRVNHIDLTSRILGAGGAVTVVWTIGLVWVAGYEIGFLVSLSV